MPFDVSLVVDGVDWLPILLVLVNLVSFAINLWNLSQIPIRGNEARESADALTRGQAFFFAILFVLCFVLQVLVCTNEKYEVLPLLGVFATLLGTFISFLGKSKHFGAILTTVYTIGLVFLLIVCVGAVNAGPDFAREMEPTLFAIAAFFSFALLVLSLFLGYRNKKRFLRVDDTVMNG